MITFETAKNQIKSFHAKKSVLHGARIASLHVGSAVLFGWVGWMALSKLTLLPGFTVAALAVVFIGTRFRAINNMSHESLHYSFVRNRRANEVFGHIFAILEFSRFLEIRRQHWSHHSSLGDFQSDLDFQHLEEYGFDRPLTRQTVSEHCGRALSLRFLPKYLFFVIYDTEEPRWAKIIRGLYLFVLLFFALAAPVPALIFLVLPYLTSYQVHKYLIDVLDHGGLLKNTEALRKKRNFQVSRFFKWIWFPRNDTYHLVHHLFPFLAVEQFPQAHKILLQVSDYRDIEHSGLKQLNQWLSSPE